MDGFYRVVIRDLADFEIFFSKNILNYGNLSFYFVFYRFWGNFRSYYKLLIFSCKRKMNFVGDVFNFDLNLICVVNYLYNDGGK